jgi:curved DNA-binding protein CbpA
MTEDEDLYARLGVAPDAAPLVISAAYRALAKQYHPDTSSERPDDAARHFRALHEAYATLSHPERRRRYDYALRSARPSEQPEQGPADHRETAEAEPMIERAQRGAAMLLLLILAASIPLLLITLGAIIAAVFSR